MNQEYECKAALSLAAPGASAASRAYLSTDYPADQELTEASAFFSTQAV